VLLIISLFALFAIVVIFLIIKEKKSPEFKAYTEDLLFGAKWRWHWAGNTITKLWCYCPSCDATLVYDDSSCRSIYANVKKTDFICENCNSQVVSSVTGGNKSYAIGAAERETAIKDETGATTRCIPFAQEKLGDVCVHCGKPAKHMVYFGKAY
jgi:hypothetical protein